MHFRLPKFVKVFLLIDFLLLLSIFFTNLGNKENNFEHFFIESKNKVEGIIDKEILSQETKDEIEALDGNWAIVVKDLKTQKAYFKNETTPFTSASLYKLTVMWATFDGIEKGSLNPDETLSKNKADLDKEMDIEEPSPSPSPSPSPEESPNQDQEEEIISYTVKNALTPMVTISDNYSALLLADKIGWENVDNLMLQVGIVGVDVKNNDVPKITAKATADILERIYKKEAVSKKASEEMLSLLFAQKFNTRIPRLLPRDIKVGHKTGELGTVRHDAGIIIGKKSDYVFVFMSDTKSPIQAEDKIAELSKTIFEELEAR